MENAAGVRDRTKKSEDDKSKHDDRDHSRVDFTEGIAIHARGRKRWNEDGRESSEGLNHR